MGCRWHCNIQEDTTRWVGNMPAGLFMPPRTANFNYIRVHGKKKWRGLLTPDQIDAMRMIVAAQTVRTSYVIFNNSFFDNRSDFCTLNDQKVGSAAVCNAADFAMSVKAKTRRRKLKVSKRVSPKMIVDSIARYVA